MFTELFDVEMGQSKSTESKISAAYNDSAFESSDESDIMSSSVAERSGLSNGSSPSFASRFFGKGIFGGREQKTGLAAHRVSVRVPYGMEMGCGGKKREQYMGKTPSKSSVTGRRVIARMRMEGKVVNYLGNTYFLASNGKWYLLCYADMAHRKDAVTWWNNKGRYFGAKSARVRKFMLNPNNYYLEHYSINRSQGALLRQHYLPPA